MARLLTLAAVCGALLLAAPLAHASVISWEGAPSSSGQTFMRPTGIAVAGSTVFVADSGRYGGIPDFDTDPRILKFDRDGNYLGQWATSFRPGALALDSSGHLYVVDPLQGTVQKYNTADGTPVGAPIGACSHCHAVGVAVDAVGNVYIDRENQIDKYDAAGAPLWTTGQFSWYSRGITIAPNGDVYVARFDPGRPDPGGIYRLAPDDGSMTAVFDAYYPEGLAVDPAGNFFVIDGHGVEKFDPSGTSLGRWDPTGRFGPYFPFGIALDDLGRLFVTTPVNRAYVDPGGRVWRLDPRDETPTVSLVQTTVPDYPLVTQLLTLDASGTTPPRLGSITKYEWDLDGDGSFETDGGTSPTIAHRFLDVGPQTVSVRVTGSNGLSATQSLTLEIGFPDSPLNLTDGTMLTGDPITFDASGFIIPFSDTLDYRWDVNGDGTVDIDTGTTPTLMHAYADRLDATVHVYVTRSGGRVDTASHAIEVLLKPPPGEPGVSINDGAFATNDRHVTLTLTWPAHSRTAIASNDGGFGDFAGTRSFDVERHVPWTLSADGADRLPRTVYVRYKPAADGPAYTDDIVLDEGLPIISSARASHRVLRVIGADYNTGVRTLLVKRAGAKRPLKTVQLGSSRSWGRRHVSVKVHLPAGRTRAYVRALDVAGNKSRWRRVSFR